jgi:hypothetical protein
MQLGSRQKDVIFAEEEGRRGGRWREGAIEGEEGDHDGSNNAEEGRRQKGLRGLRLLTCRVAAPVHRVAEPL